MYGLFCWWWLRSPGNNQNNAANVNNAGDVNENGNNVNNDNNAVRPALLSYGLKLCVSTQSPCREQRNRIPSRIFGKTYVGGRDNTNCFMLLRRKNGCARLFFRPADEIFIMTDYEKLYDFQNLYKAHTVARRSKRTTREVIEFEMNLGENLTSLSDA